MYSIETKNFIQIKMYHSERKDITINANSNAVNFYQDSNSIVLDWKTLADMWTWWRDASRAMDNIRQGMSGMYDSMYGEGSAVVAIIEEADNIITLSTGASPNIIKDYVEIPIEAIDQIADHLQAAFWQFHTTLMNHKKD
jgi:hypothetical protein